MFEVDKNINTPLDSLMTQPEAKSSFQPNALLNITSKQVPFEPNTPSEQTEGPNSLKNKYCFEVERIFHFEAGHLLVHHDGKCREPHGHNYAVKVTIRADEMIASGPKKGMVMDFACIGNVVKPMISTYFDHKWLNDTLKSDSPTAEYMAKWIFDFLDPKLPGLYSITVYETNTSIATYRKI